jgi:hypothetical protein
MFLHIQIAFSLKIAAKQQQWGFSIDRRSSMTSSSSHRDKSKCTKATFRRYHSANLQYEGMTMLPQIHRQSHWKKAVTRQLTAAKPGKQRLAIHP